jgi:hypothetical protein
MISESQVQDGQSFIDPSSLGDAFASETRRQGIPTAPALSSSINLALPSNIAHKKRADLNLAPENRSSSIGDLLQSRKTNGFGNAVQKTSALIATSAQRQSGMSLSGGKKFSDSLLGGKRAMSFSSSLKLGGATVDAGTTSEKRKRMAGEAMPTTRRTLFGSDADFVVTEEEKRAAQQQVPKKTKSPVREFLKEAKSLLSAEQYAKFKSALQEYKTSKQNVDLFIKGVISILGTTRRVDLIEQFVIFLPHKHHAKYKMAAAIMKKEIMKTNKTKKGMLESPEGAALCRRILVCSVCGAFVCIFDTLLFVSVSRACFLLYVPAKPKSSKKLTCMICQDDTDDPFVAECGHTACLKCWKTWLVKQSTCPQCRKRTTTSRLVKIDITVS